MSPRKNPHITGPKIDPPAITGKESAADLVDQAFLAYNGARLREGARLLNERMLENDVTVALSITGALTPAGLGMSAIIPLMRAGFVDWIVSTGANLYHDTHFGLGLSMHTGDWQADDVELREQDVVRIYDIFFDYSVLLDTDAFFREIIALPEFQRTMSTAEFHYLCGKYVRAREDKLGLKHRSLLAAAYEYGVPIYTSSPGRLLDRHERRGQGARGQPARCSTSAPTSTRPRRSCGTPRRAAARARCGSWAAAAPRTSCCRPSRRSRKCSASPRRATTTSWR